MIRELQLFWPNLENVISHDEGRKGREALLSKGNLKVQTKKITLCSDIIYIQKTGWRHISVYIGPHILTAGEMCGYIYTHFHATLLINP